MHLSPGPYLETALWLLDMFVESYLPWKIGIL